MLEGNLRIFKANTPSKVKVEITETKARDGKSSAPVVRWSTENNPVPEEVEPLRSGEDVKYLKRPGGSGGMLAAFYLYHRLLTLGEKGYENRCDHGGREPLFPPRPDNRPPANLKELRVEAEVLNSRFGPYQVKWFFTGADRQLRAFEVRLDDNEDPCEVYLSDYRQVNGRSLPHRMQVYHADKHFATFEFNNFRLSAK